MRGFTNPGGRGWGNSQPQPVLAPGRAGAELEFVDGTIADDLADATVISVPVPSGLEERNRFGETERIVAPAASAGTRRQYG